MQSFLTMLVSSVGTKVCCSFSLSPQHLIGFLFSFFSRVHFAVERSVGSPRLQLRREETEVNWVKWLRWCFQDVRREEVRCCAQHKQIKDCSLCCSRGNLICQGPETVIITQEQSVFCAAVITAACKSLRGGWASLTEGAKAREHASVASRGQWSCSCALGRERNRVFFTPSGVYSHNIPTSRSLFLT